MKKILEKLLDRKLIKINMLVVLILFGLSSIVFAQEDVLKKAETGIAAPGLAANVGPQFGGTFQMLGVWERLKDDTRDDNRIYLYEAQARVHVAGKVDNIDYYFLVEYGSEEVPKSNTVMSLADAYIDAPLISSHLGVRVGQFTTPYSREMLSTIGNPDSLEFANYSINTLAFDIGRDTGIALHGTVNNFAAAFGIFTGGGIDIPQRYIPEEMNVPMLVARIGYNTLDKSIFDVKQFDPNFSGTGFAVYASGMYEKDSRIGHSSIMSSKNTDISLFYDKNWNPYLRANTPSEIEIGTLTQGEADFAFQTDIGKYKVNGAAEVNYGEYKNPFGSITMKGGEVQTGIYLAPVQLALRYAVLFPSTHFGYYTGGTTYPILSKAAIHEINPALNIYLSSHVKLTMDMQIWIHVPIAQENKASGGTGAVGAYNLMTMPDQVTILAKGDPIERQNAITGRMNFQLVF